MNLSIKILIAFILAVIVGLVAGVDALPFINWWIAPIGTIFLNLIKMVIVPIVFFSLVVGILQVGGERAAFLISLFDAGAEVSYKIIGGVISLFIANVFGVNLTLGQMAMIVLTGTLASIGTAGVPGAGIIMLAMVLQSVGLPMEGLALVAGIDRILDMFRTCLNITGDAPSPS